MNVKKAKKNKHINKNCKSYNIDYEAIKSEKWNSRHSIDNCRNSRHLCGKPIVNQEFKDSTA